MKLGSGKKSRTKTEGEKPFWISYADLMSALMALFLVVMVASLVKQVGERNSKENQRKKEVSSLCSEIKKTADSLNFNKQQYASGDSTSVEVDCKNNSIKIAKGGFYKTGSHKLGDLDEKQLFALIPKVLAVANDTRGKAVFRRVVVEGYTDTTASYLTNLDLSLKRSHWFICRLLSNSSPLGFEQKKLVRALFFIGGDSFNKAELNDSLSRRIELKMEFYEVGEASTRPKENSKAMRDTSSGTCQLD